MEKWKKRSVDLLTSLAFGSKGSPSVIPYYPQKTDVSGVESRYFVRSTPERHGISSKRIYNMLCELEAEARANIHNLMVLCENEVISECSRDGYSTGVWHLSHSMSKSVTGMAIGVLFDDGALSLDTRLVDIFPEIPYRDKSFPLITVEHLLAMTTGVTFGEAGSVTETDWTQAFFASSVKFIPGSDFAYNSMNSYILAKIVTRITGKSLCELLDERIFGPLHIENYFWEIGPEGVEKGGWGLYMSPESWAKLGQLLLQDGVFEDRVVLSEKWIDKSSKKQATSPEINGDFNYGYQMWVGRNSEEILFNGMLGQNVWISPKNNIVVVVNCGNNELFQNSPALEIIRKHLGCDIKDREFNRKDIKVLHEKEYKFFDCRRWVTPLEKKHGFLYWLGVRNRTAYDDKWNDALGEYVFARNNVGILPLFIRGMQNNLDASLESLKLEKWGSGVYLTFRESGVNYRVEIGLYEYKDAILDFRGEKYMVKVMGEAIINADGGEEYRIEFLFPELPNTRFIRIMPKGDGRMQVDFTEIPNNRIADMLLDRVPAASPALGLGLDILERRFGEGFINRKVENTFAPMLIGADKASPDFDTIIEEEKMRAEEQSRTVRLLRAFVDRFFKDENREEEKMSKKKEKPAENKFQRGFLGDLIDRIKASRLSQSDKPQLAEAGGEVSASEAERSTVGALSNSEVHSFDTAVGFDGAADSAETACLDAEIESLVSEMSEASIDLDGKGL